MRSGFCERGGFQLGLREGVLADIGIGECSPAHLLGFSLVMLVEVGNAVNEALDCSLLVTFLVLITQHEYPILEF